MCWGVMASLSKDIFMASILAFKMFILSICSGGTMATANAKALFSIAIRNSSLLFLVSSLESLRPTIGCFNITAAATTGPARHPLPASSHPASMQLAV